MPTETHPKPKRRRVLPFGERLGVAPPGVPAFSSNYKTAPSAHRGFFRAHHDGVYTGYKYQCVEYARRWLVHAMGVTFGDVRMAYEIFNVPALIRICDKGALPVIRCRNGVSVGKHPEAMPRLGSILIWQEGGFFRHTGHVAIVVEATESYVRIAEQNVTDAAWPSGVYSRELPVERGEDGEYTIREKFKRSHVLGWLHLPEDTHGRQADWHAERMGASKPEQQERQVASATPETVRGKIVLLAGEQAPRHHAEPDADAGATSSSRMPVIDISSDDDGDQSSVVLSTNAGPRRQDDAASHTN